MVNFLQGGDPILTLLNKYKQLENGISFIIFIGLVILPATDLLIREIIRPIIPTLSKIPGSQTIVSHLTLLIGFAGAIIAARENKLLALTTIPLFGSDELKGLGKYIAKWVSICVILILAIGSLDLVLIEKSVLYPVFVAPNVPRWFFSSSNADRLFSYWRPFDIQEQGKYFLTDRATHIIFYNFTYSFTRYFKRDGIYSISWNDFICIGGCKWHAYFF